MFYVQSFGDVDKAVKIAISSRFIANNLTFRYFVNGFIFVFNCLSLLSKNTLVYSIYCMYIYTGSMKIHSYVYERTSANKCIVK